MERSAKKARVDIRLDLDLYKKVKRLAKKKDVKISYLVRMALRDFIDRELG